MHQINEASKKLLDKNGTGVVPKHVWFNRPKDFYDRPSFLAVKNNQVWFEGTKAQCKRFIS